MVPWSEILPRRAARLLLILAGLAPASLASAQTTLRGMVYDPSGRIVVDALVTVQNEAGKTWRQRSSELGGCSFSLPPGRYSVRAEFDDYEPVTEWLIVRPRIMEAFNLRFRYTARESITVHGAAAIPNRVREPGVATIFSRPIIEDMPLANGRVVQSFASFVPGIVVTESVGTLAQFTAVGQRRFANRLTIDGMSADLAVDVRGQGIGDAGGGSLPATSTLGGTQTLVPLDAIEEIQVRTINAAPEHARTPGAQIAIVTRAGGDRLRGGAFTDVRPDRLTASDWFANAGATSPRRVPPRELHYWNGGTSLGGPLFWKRLSFFGAWERQQIDRQLITKIPVPSQTLRQQAAASVKPLLAVYPQPNTDDMTGAVGEYADRFPASSNFDVGSLRVDGVLSSRNHVFVRVNRGRSKGDEISDDLRIPRLSFSHIESTQTQTLTAGMQTQFGSLLNDLRVNTTEHDGRLVASSASDGETQPLLLTGLIPSDVDPSDTWVQSFFLFPGRPTTYSSGVTRALTQHQVQLLDVLSLNRGRHAWRFGMNYQRVTASSEPAQHRYTYTFNYPSDVSAGMASAYLEHYAPARVFHHTVALFAQDSFRASPRLALTYGVRYSLAPAPVSRTELEPLLFELEALPELQPRDEGARLWKMSRRNFGPQISAAYRLDSTLRWESILRAGWSVVFDELSNPGTAAFGQGFPYIAVRSVGRSTLPLKQSEFIVSKPASFLEAEIADAYAFSRDLRPPRTYSWQVGLDQALGDVQRLGLAYVGTAGRDLVYSSVHFADTRHTIQAFSNDGRSDYHGLMMEFVRRWSRGLQARVAYAWSHAIDTDSGEPLSAVPLPSELRPEVNRGSSDFDRPHVLGFTASYRLPTPRGFGFVTSVGKDWQIDVVGTMQSSAPFSVTSKRRFGTGAYRLRLDTVPSAPQWVDDPDSPGGKRLNRSAFTEPVVAGQGALVRNSLRGKALRQADLSLSRSIRLHGRMAARIHVDAFNVFNVANFAPPDGKFDEDTFGRSLMSYADNLGTGTLTRGGLTPVQQIGGPRSIQIGIRLDY